MNAWHSLRHRLVASYLALALILLTITGLVFSAALRMYAQVSQRERAVGYFTQAQSILAEARAAGMTAEQALALLRQRLPDLKVEREPAGVVELARPRPFGLSPARGLTLFQPPENLNWGLVYGNGGGVRAVMFRFTVPDQQGAVVRSIMAQVAVVLALALGLAGVVGWWFSRWLARPLTRLADATAAVAGGDFLQTVDPPGITELDQVATQFNRMVLSLRDSFRSLAAERDVARRFAVDAAHQLRTPVAALRAYQDVVSGKPDRLPQALPAMNRQVERMEDVIDGLLEMAALAEGTGVTLTPADLGEVVRRLAPNYHDLADEYGHTLEIEEPDAPLPVRQDPRLVELALSNLLDNACKYTPPGGRIRLVLQRDGRDAVISVIDPGPGIPPEELPFIFARFHRGVDTQSVPGSGLGLAIVREAAQRLGGTVTVHSEVGRGSRFDLRLPLMTA